jgi:hypothetical protein
MTNKSDHAPLDLFPSEDDSEVLTVVTGQTESVIGSGRTVRPEGEAPDACQNSEQERGSFPGAPAADTPTPTRVLHLGDATPTRMPSRGRAVVICTTAALVACLVVAIVWVTTVSVSIDISSPPDEASTFGPLS